MCCIIFKPPKNVISYSLWVFNVAKLFGFIPFSVRKKGMMREPHVTIWNVIWMVITISVYGLCIYAVFAQDYANLPYSQLQVLIVNTANMSGGLVAIFGIVMDLVNRRRIWKMTETFNDFDSEVRTVFFVYRN